MNRYSTAQQIEQMCPLEELAHPGGRVDNPERAVYRRRHVECSNQLAHPCGIYSRHRGQIQDDPALSAAKQSVDVMAQRPAQRQPKRIFDMEDLTCFRTWVQDCDHGFLC